jgi:DNA-binding response OmpR family regulator
VPEKNGIKFRILIVEDEALLAFGLEQDLIDAGYATLGPFRDIQSAFSAVTSESFDLAILDVNLHGEMVYPVADVLLHRSIPFLFLSGYGGGSMPERFRGYPRMAKPYNQTLLLRELAVMLPHRKG